MKVSLYIAVIHCCLERYIVLLLSSIVYVHVYLHNALYYMYIVYTHHAANSTWLHLHRQFYSLQRCQIHLLSVPHHGAVAGLGPQQAGHQ